MTATSTNVVWKPTTVAPSSSPSTHADGRCRDPGQGAEPATAGQPLPGPDDGTGDQPGQQGGEGVVDPAGDQTAGHAGDRERQESGRPPQPRPAEGVSSARGGGHEVAVLGAAERTGSDASPGDRAWRRMRMAKMISQTLHKM